MRRKQVLAVETVAMKIAPDVERHLEGRNLYALRKTHVSWARQLVNPDSVKLQVGHAPQDVEERHYLDLVDARVSSQAVWDVLTGKSKLSGEQEVIGIDRQADVSKVETEKVHPNLHHNELSQEKRARISAFRH